MYRVLSMVHHRLKFAALQFVLNRDQISRKDTYLIEIDKT